jgi:8-oxo-dGTP pyrophosphatase MutT (NUDIX family)
VTSADGYTRCALGHEHWGRAGAAGLLVRHRDEDGVRRYLLQHRAARTHLGDTWGLPGGALDWTESAEEGARRESVEELGGLPDDLTTVRTHRDDHGGWAYSTVVVDSPVRFSPVVTGWEVGEHGYRWCTRDELADLPLHPGFAASLDHVLD